MTDEPNPFLSVVMRMLRRLRPPLPGNQHFLTRVEKVPAGNYVEIWFRTAGCSWDRAGGCTMCNYGRGAPVTGEDVLAAVDGALRDLTEQPHELMISPSGSLWDHKEVPPEALGPLYARAARTGMRRFLLETRTELVTPDRVADLCAALCDTELAVEVGLESAFDPVLTYCVNKRSGGTDFQDAAALLAQHGVMTYANVSLGTAFLRRDTAIRDAAASVLWSLRNGADVAVLFPLHTKPFTLLEFLRRQGRYDPVSLWDLVETLHTVGPDATKRLEIAWYHDYYSAGPQDASPTGCATCLPLLSKGLKEYRAIQDFGVVDSLMQQRCPCAGPPRLDSPPQSDEEIARDILESYAFLAAHLRLEDLWARRRTALEPALRRAFTGYSEAIGDPHAR